MEISPADISQSNISTDPYLQQECNERKKGGEGGRKRETGVEQAESSLEEGGANGECRRKKLGSKPGSHQKPSPKAQHKIK